jgi:hypothetical protein
VIRPALDALRTAGIPFATRGVQPIDDPPPGGDVDVLVGERDADAAERVLASAGFRRLVSPGHRRHRFFLAFDGERARWLKIDVSLVPARLEWDLEATDPRSLERFAAYRVGTKSDPGALERAWAWVEQRRPLGVRRQGPIVAMLGPDGAGKGSVIAALRSEIPVQVTALYFGRGERSRAEYGRPSRRPPGTSPSAAWRIAQRVVRLLPAGGADLQRGFRRGMGGSVRAWRSYLYAWRGDVVLCDRHPLEGLAVTTPHRSPGRALERWLLRRLVPWPDRLVLLEAPGATLFARKGEHSPELLDGWGRAYRDALGSRATAISTVQPLDRSVAATSALVWQALAERRGW